MIGQMAIAIALLGFLSHFNARKLPQVDLRSIFDTSNAASHDKHEKINLWVSFFSYMSMELRFLAAGAPLEIWETRFFATFDGAEQILSA